MTTEISGTTLETHLRERMLGETGPNLLPEWFEIQRSLVAGLNRAENQILGHKPFLEDFAIQNIPTTIDDTDIFKQIGDYYLSQGYQHGNHNFWDLCFQKNEQMVGINLTYCPEFQSCIVSIHDLSS
ncbi:hypothetical protein GOV12_02555 [Candidatus Pacearchaeota archaeon]|nr:hypothetical protein [Candidatus Pacearchaeota archaeon]